MADRASAGRKRPRSSTPAHTHARGRSPAGGERPSSGGKPHKPSAWKDRKSSGAGDDAGGKHAPRGRSFGASGGSKRSSSHTDRGRSSSHTDRERSGSRAPHKDRSESRPRKDGGDRPPRPAGKGDSAGKDGKPRKFGAGKRAGAGKFDGKPRPGKKITKEDAERLREERKASKPYSGLMEQAVTYWNELRERKTPKERKLQLVDAIIKLIRGRVVEIAGRHDVSRVVQGCIKHGSAAQREYVCKELYGHMLEFTKSKHGHQLVSKVLRYGSPAVRAQVHKEFKGNVSRLMTHNFGALVVEAGATRAWSTAQNWELYQELYGAEYVNFKAPEGVARNLSAVLEARDADAKKRRATLEHMFYVLGKATDKSLMSLSFLQKLLYEFLTTAPPEQVVAAVSLVREHMLALVSTREGAAAAALCFAYGTPKDRKQMFKSLKGHMLRVALHDHGHMTLITALAVTDDTRLSTDAVFDELRPHIPFLACHRFGRKVLLHLCAPRSSTHFSPADLALLQPVTLPAYLLARKAPDAPPAAGEKAGATEATGEAAGAAAAADPAAAAAAAVRVAFPAPPAAELLADPVKSAPTRTSKKADDVRTRELLTALAKDLESALLTHTALLARDTHGSAVLYEAAAALGRLHGANSDSYKRVLAAIADLLVSEPSPEEVFEQRREMHAAVATALAGGVDTAAADAAHAGAKKSQEEDDAAVGRKKARLVDGAGSAGEDEEMPDGGEGEDDDDEMMGEEDGEDDDEDNDEDENDDEEEGGAEAAMVEEAPAMEAEILPILEHPPSHLLFKWLLLREAAPKDDSSDGVAPAKFASVQPLPAGEPALFSALFYERMAGGLAELATSNRAFFTIVQLVSSRDTAVVEAARKELRDHLAELQARPDSAGKNILLKLLTPPPAAAKGTPAAKAAKGVASTKKAEPSEPAAKTAATPAASKAAPRGTPAAPATKATPAGKPTTAKKTK